jgi:hypothetical protein
MPTAPSAAPKPSPSQNDRTGTGFTTPAAPHDVCPGVGCDNPTRWLAFGGRAVVNNAASASS